MRRAITSPWTKYPQVDLSGSDSKVDPEDEMRNEGSVTESLGLEEDQEIDMSEGHNSPNGQLVELFNK